MVESQPGKRTNLSHEERTATEPRNKDLHEVVFDRIDSVNNKIRLLRLGIKNKQRGINFLPGQWLDVFAPGVEKAGGFTITSTPREALPDPSDASVSPYLELAVQESPSNPPAAWLWRQPEEILGSELLVRVGGSFVWPPHGVDLKQIQRVIFIAGGVGINPLISMLAHIRQSQFPLEHMRFLYSTRMPPGDPKASEILFLPRLLDIFKASIPTRDPGPRPRLHRPQSERLELFLTGSDKMAHPDGRASDYTFQPENSDDGRGPKLPLLTWSHRMDDATLTSALGNQQEQRGTVVYVCGPPDMTDQIVEWVRGRPGMTDNRVLCEKWW